MRSPSARPRRAVGRAGGSVLAIAALIGGLVWLASNGAPGVSNQGSPGPSSVAGLPTNAPSAPITVATASPSADPLASRSPGPTRAPVAIDPAPIPSGRIATRVVVPGLRIDLPVTRQTTTYPACGVAMYILDLGQPGGGGVTYLYAHAQAGMFLPLYQESLVNDGARMVGMPVEVYTGDSLKFSYRIIEVRRHVTTMDGAYAWRGESVFLQTSEGPRASDPKLQVVAEHVSTEAATYEASHPEPRPFTCR